MALSFRYAPHFGHFKLFSTITALAIESDTLALWMFPTSSVFLNLLIKSGSSLQVKVPISFEIKSGKTTTIVLDITADETLISASNNLRPVVTGQVTSGP